MCANSEHKRQVPAQANQGNSGARRCYAKRQAPLTAIDNCARASASRVRTTTRMDGTHCARRGPDHTTTIGPFWKLRRGVLKEALRANRSRPSHLTSSSMGTLRLRPPRIRLIGTRLVLQKCKNIGSQTTIWHALSGNLPAHIYLGKVHNRILT